MRRSFGPLIALCSLLLASPPLPAEDPSGSAASEGRIEAAGQWKLETLRLKDGRQYHGLVQAERAGEIELVEIVRPPGKPMYAVVRGVDRRLVERLERLPAEQRAELQRRFERFKNRVLIEAGRMEDVVLDEVQRNGVRYHSYDGHWFTLWSTADPEMTRRCIVRIEQIFRAYRQLLPPRIQQPGGLHVLLYASMDQYRAYLKQQDLPLENPAFYSASQNLIVAGSDLARYSRQLAQTRARHESLRRQANEPPAQFSQRLAQLGSQLEQNGFSADEIRTEMKLRWAAWHKHQETLLKRIQEADRRNQARFAELTEQMFARLYHEAFHAYLENYVYPHRQYDVHPWLNEGLAQIFETGQLEADTLRIDAPSPGALARLQRDLSGPSPLPLAELLAAPQQAFLATHASSSSQQHYLYSWGLAYYLTFHQNLLGSSAMDRYVSTAAARLDPISRFEQLVGCPLPEFECRWRDAMRQ